VPNVLSVGNRLAIPLFPGRSLSRALPYGGNKAFERQGDLPFLGLVFVLFHEFHMVAIRVGAEADADRTFGKLEVHRSGNELNPLGL